MKQLSKLYRMNGYVMMLCIIATFVNIAREDLVGIMLGTFGYFSSIYLEKRITRDMKRLLSENVEHPQV